MEKHWKSVISRSVCDYFFDEQRKVSSSEDIPPVIATPHHYLISIHRCGIFFVAVCMSEGGLNIFKKTQYFFYAIQVFKFSIALTKKVKGKKLRGQICLLFNIETLINKCTITSLIKFQ